MSPLLSSPNWQLKVAKIDPVTKRCVMEIKSLYVEIPYHLLYWIIANDSIGSSIVRKWQQHSKIGVSKRNNDSFFLNLMVYAVLRRYL